ncbi:hypothetical protein PS898_05425 [Pseudomonas fluorescens]|nr:hypothetical protein PS898_05425 [Pseudomonas fluorescens]
MPVTDQAAQQIGATQKRRVSRCRATQDKMVTATGTGVPAVDHELLGGQSRLARLFVKKFGAFDQLIPGGGRLHVDLDHAWVRRNPEVAQARIARRLIAFQQHRAMQFFSRGLDGADQFQVILDPLQRRHEQIQPTFPRLGAKRRTGQPVCGFVDSGHALVSHRRVVMTLQLRGVRQRREILVRVLGMDKWILRRFHPRLRAKWQAIAQRRIPRYQSAVLFTQIPAPALPLIALGRARQRKELAKDLVQALAEDFAQSRTLQWFFQG